MNNEAGVWSFCPSSFSLTKGYRSKCQLRNLIGKWRRRANARNVISRAKSRLPAFASWLANLIAFFCCYWSMLSWFLVDVGLQSAGVAIRVISREFRKRQQQPQRRHESMIWLAEWGKIIVLHVRHAFFVKMFGRSQPNKDMKMSYLRFWRRGPAVVNL